MRLDLPSDMRRCSADQSWDMIHGNARTGLENCSIGCYLSAQMQMLCIITVKYDLTGSTPSCKFRPEDP